MLWTIFVILLVMWLLGMATSYTLGGTPGSCAAGLAMLDAISQDALVARSQAVGDAMLARIKQITRDNRLVGEVRGRGLLIGIEFVTGPDLRSPNPDAANTFASLCMDRGLFVVPCGVYGNVIEIAPPLVVTEHETKTGLDAFEGALNELSQQLDGSLS